jgi:hypothetical protein
MQGIEIYILMFFNAFLFSQTWIDAGAEWHYRYYGFSDLGFYKVNYVADTIIDGKVCQKLEQSKYVFSVDQNNRCIILVLTHLSLNLLIYLVILYSDTRIISLTFYTILALSQEILGI